MSGNTNMLSNPLAVLKPAKEQRLYSLSEYLQREERSKERHEYYNGTIIKLPMARIPHNLIVPNISAELIFAFRLKNKPFKVLGSQQLIYLPELNFSLYPDVLVVAEMPQSWNNNEVLLINPLLIIEVLSRSTKKYDRTEKFEAYKTLESFREYVLIDPDKCHIETRYREEPHLWRDTTCKNLEDKIELRSVDCAIELSSIYSGVTFKK